MSRVPTVRTKGPTGDLVVINEADYDPAKHRLFDTPEAPKETKASKEPEVTKTEKVPEAPKESEKSPEATKAPKDPKAEKATKKSRPKIEE